MKLSEIYLLGRPIRHFDWAENSWIQWCPNKQSFFDNQEYNLGRSFSDSDRWSFYEEAEEADLIWIAHSNSTDGLTLTKQKKCGLAVEIDSIWALPESLITLGNIQGIRGINTNPVYCSSGDTMANIQSPMAIKQTHTQYLQMLESKLK